MIAAVGATLLTVRVKVVVAVRPPSSVAVMVTVVGPPGPSAGCRTSSRCRSASSRVIVPSEAVRVTVPWPWASSKVPLFVTGLPSLTVTAARLQATVGGWSCTSKAPMSTAAPTSLAKPGPRWSVVTGAIQEDGVVAAQGVEADELDRVRSRRDGEGAGRVGGELACPTA